VDVSFLSSGIYFSVVKQQGFAPKVQKMVKSAYSE